MIPKEQIMHNQYTRKGHKTSITSSNTLTSTCKVPSSQYNTKNCFKGYKIIATSEISLHFLKKNLKKIQTLDSNVDIYDKAPPICCDEDVYGNWDMGE